MEHTFDIKELEHKPVAKKQELTIVKICKKNKPVDEVFPEKDVEKMNVVSPLLIDKLDKKLIDRNDILKRLNKLMNGQEL
jgi:hypothetical protein